MAVTTWSNDEDNALAVGMEKFSNHRSKFVIIQKEYVY